MLNEQRTHPSLPLRHGTAHPGCFVCSNEHPAGLRLKFRCARDGSVNADFACERRFEGYRGIIHGGIVAALLDGGMTNCLYARGVIGMTADLHVRYRHPLRVGEPATVFARVTTETPRLFILDAEVVQGEVIKARATGKFIRIEETR